MKSFTKLLSGCALIVASLFSLALAAAGQTGPLHTLSGHVPPGVSRLTPLGRAPETDRMELAIGLPLRNKETLTNLLQQLYDPASPRFHHYLTPTQFTEQFGPSEEDYQTVAAFARANGFEVTKGHSNRLVLDVRAPVSSIEHAFHLHLNRYQHPTENRTFVAPDSEPSLDASVPALSVAGLSDYVQPRALCHKVQSAAAAAAAPQGTGSSPGGGFMGNDFRAAYVPGVSLTGTGQTVGLVEFYSGYYQSDITAYENMCGLPNVPVTPVLIDGYDGSAGWANDEVSLDIEMAISMAPGLAGVRVYEGESTDDVLNSIATENVAKQIGTSWTYPIDATSEQIFLEFAAQGQSYFNASGDSDAYPGSPDSPTDDPNITIVGGTTLTTTGPGGSWVSETVWNWGGIGSSGGISATYPIPAWQQGVNMSANGGSTTMRNLPDVALTADNVYVMCGNGSPGIYGGTSCATPLWAAFTALVNQQSVQAGHPTVGFLNPTVYAIGQSASYASVFHDITTGNNTSDYSPNEFYAVPGYDLCTGWGTPAGGALISALAPSDELQISPPAGFNAGGGVGGPFAGGSQALILSNSSTGSLNWDLGNSTSWLTVSAVQGTLAAGQTTTVTVSLNSTADTLPAGNYTASLWITNLSDSVTQFRQYTLAILAPPTIVTQPASQALNYGQAAVLSVTTAGGQPMSYQWWANGAPLRDGGAISGSGTSTLNISSLTASNAGAYYVVVSNAAAVVTSQAANLSVSLSPSIYQQPASQTVAIGGSAVFTVGAYGAPPLTYQWSFAGANLPGETGSSLALYNVQPSQAGNYAVTVSNAYGEALSASATLSAFTGESELITFDGLGSDTPVINGYAGLNWSNFMAFNYSDMGVWAYNNYGGTASISQSAPFNLISAQLFAYQQDSQQVEVKGYVGKTLAYDSIYTIVWFPTTLQFNYNGVTEVDFVPLGGGSVDDLTFYMQDIAVDVPTSSLQVTISPPEAISAGAQFNVDGGPWQNSGATVNNLIFGYHAINYSSAGSWTVPQSQYVNLTSFATATATGVYAVTPFTFIENPDGTLAIAGYQGPQSVSIPSTWNGLAVTVIGSNAFYGQPVTNVTIPNSIVKIQYQAFAGAGIKNVIVPASVTNIGANAFAECYSLTNAALTNGLLSIGDNAFTSCWMRKATIPATVTSLGVAPFEYCARLTAINVDPANPAFVSVSGVLFDSSQTALIEYPDNKSGSYTVPTGVTSIWPEAFAGAVLTNVTIPYTVTGIGSHAFFDCTSLSAACFQGNAPAGADSTVFQYDTGLTIYYSPATSGWTSSYEGFSTVMLNAPAAAGSLQVSISPAMAVAAGAQWQVDGGIPQPSGATVLGLSAGVHTVSFSGVNGWTAPVNQSLTVSASQTAATEGVYGLMPPALATSATPLDSAGFHLTVSAAAGVSVVVQGSTDLVTWENLGTNTGSFTFTDSAALNGAHRFYRLVTH